ncbi:MAG TPA: threonylcarbamoyl-AMP synthase [Legionella sp.]|nr:threonylcarbamoyl-AMP synthase [Legionella sp.]
MNILSQVGDARAYLKQGKIIAYPTEAVYGLGCDPFNPTAVEALLALKKRPDGCGFILLIADWSQLAPLVSDVSEEALNAVRATWPGPVTWVFPKAAWIPAWLTGAHDGIAIRMSAHPVAHALCADGPVVSTSANIHCQKPAMDIHGLQLQFPAGLDAVLMGELGGQAKPSAIYDVRSGQSLREPL